MTLLVNQNFEGTGFDNGETWVTYAGDQGAADPNYTTNPLLGSQSLHINDDNDEGTYAVTKFGDDTGYNALYGFFRFKITDYPGGVYEVMQTYNAQGSLSAPTSTEPHEMIWIGTDGKLHVYHGLDGELGAGTHVVELNTIHYIWWYFSRDASGRSTGWLKVSESKSIPAGNDIAWTNVSIESTYRGTNAVGFTTFHGAAYDYIVDQVIVADTAIGNSMFSKMTIFRR